MDALYIEFLSNPVYVYVGRVSNELKWHFHPHKHDKLVEIMYITSGKTVYSIDNVEYQAESGDVLVVNSGLVHEELYWHEQSIEMFYCAISNLNIKGMPEGHLIPDSISPVLKVGAEEPTIKTLFSKLFQEGHERNPGFNIICNNLVSTLSVIILRLVNKTTILFDTQEGFSNAFMLSSEVKRYIDSNFTQSLSVEHIAKAFHIAPSYLAYIFKKHIGVPPIHYQISRRMDEAKRLLSCTDLKVKAIASMVGYENINNFYEPFKRYTGMKPGQYRQMIKEHMD